MFIFKPSCDKIYIQGRGIMKFKRVLIPALLSLCVLSLSSCDIMGFIKDNAGIDPSGIINTIPEETYTPVDIDEDNKDYGYLDLQKYESIKNQLIGLYTDIDNACKEFMNSDRTLAKETRLVGGSNNDYYIIKDQISYSVYGLTYSEAAAVYKTVTLDRPEYYFLSNTLLSSTYEIGGSRREYLALVCDPDYYQGSVRQQYNQQLEAYDATIKATFTTGDDILTKIQKIHDYIVTHSQYAFKADGETPDDSSFAHNLLGIVVNQKGVCESYAELFQYLLNKNDIYCILVTGDAYDELPAIGEGEAHAWNYVKLNYSIDGETVSKWYGFDVTWDDPVPNQPLPRYTYYGRVDSEFTDSHVPDLSGNLSTGLSYMYSLPTLADAPIHNPGGLTFPA